MQGQSSTLLIRPSSLAAAAAALSPADPVTREIPEQEKQRSGRFPLAPMAPLVQCSGMSTAILKDAEFTLVSQFVSVDGKKRVLLSGAAPEGVRFNVYRNKCGQIVLDPVKAVPTSEAWLWENGPALASVKRGIQQSTTKKGKNLGSFAASAEEKAP